MKKFFNAETAVLFLGIFGFVNPTLSFASANRVAYKLKVTYADDERPRGVLSPEAIEDITSRNCMGVASKMVHIGMSFTGMFSGGGAFAWVCFDLPENVTPPVHRILHTPLKSSETGEVWGMNSEDRAKYYAERGERVRQNLEAAIGALTSRCETLGGKLGSSLSVPMSSGSMEENPREEMVAVCFAR